ncbi:MAG: zinc-binding dehydrogenase [Fimbriimonas sp.]
MKAQAVLFAGVNQVEIGDVEVPEPEEGEVLLRADFTAISPGTELRCLTGLQPGYSFPSVPGYSFVGTVIQSRSGLAEGTRIFCGGTERCSAPRGWGGHISLAVRSAASCCVIPDNLDSMSATLARLAAISHRGYVITDRQPGTKVAVIGLGPIGQFSARLFHLGGADVVGFDLSAERVEVLQAAGVPAQLVTGDLAAAVHEQILGGADVVVDATGAAAVLPSSLKSLRAQPWEIQGNSPQLVIQGSYSDTFRLNYQEAFERELRILFPRDSGMEDFHTVLDLMARPEGLQVKDLIAGVFPFGRAADAYARLQDSKGSALTFCLDWS